MPALHHPRCGCSPGTSGGEDPCEVVGRTYTLAHMYASLALTSLKLVSSAASIIAQQQGDCIKGIVSA
jgi:hypothetical protein